MGVRIITNVLLKLEYLLVIVVQVRDFMLARKFGKIKKILSGYKLLTGGGWDMYAVKG